LEQFWRGGGDSFVAGSSSEKGGGELSVVDWGFCRESRRRRLRIPAMQHIFGRRSGGYRLSERNWKKLLDGKFYNPMYRAAEVDATKVMMFHAQDDPYVPYRSVQKFARLRERG